MHNPIKRGININLEALRGFAALFVVLGHVLALNQFFDAQYLPTITVVFAPSPHLPLLVFFVLSGYVITASNPELSTGHKVLTYIKKRILRIYPIYFVAMLITLLIAGFHYPVYAIIANFAMLQVLLVPQFFENGPAWSLHFEALYYLLYIPVSFFRLNTLAIFFISAFIAVGNYYFYPNIYTPLISSYLFGFTFWIGGACIAKYLSNTHQNVPYNVLLSVLFFLLAIDQLVQKSGFPQLIDKINYGIFHYHLLYPNVEGSKIVLSYTDLAFLPYCLYFVLIFSGRKFKYEKVFFSILQLPIIYALIVTATETRHLHLLSFMVPVAYYIISLTLLFVNSRFINKTGQIVIKFGAWLGGISYAMYIIHAPIIFALGKINFFDNHILSYITRFVLLIVLVLGLSYVLEKIFQPYMKKLFATKNSPNAHINV